MNINRLILVNKRKRSKHTLGERALLLLIIGGSISITGTMVYAVYNGFGMLQALMTNCV